MRRKYLKPQNSNLAIDHFSTGSIKRIFIAKQQNMKTIRDGYFKYVGQTSPKPLGLDVASAKGIYLYDHSGQPYLDLISGISVSSLGHGNSKIIKAVQNQAEKYMHTMVYGEHIHAPQVEYAKNLFKHLPDSLDNIFYVNSGTEATEGAMKLVKKVTGRYEIIACKNAYHGSTHGSQSLMSDEYFSKPYRPFLPGIKFIDYNNIESLNTISAQTAGVFVETIQGEAGIKVASQEFMDALRKKCDETGALLVFDEIQTGFGRTGKMFAFEHYGVIPDVMLIAKAMGGGMPIGAFVASQKHMKSLSENPILGHINTFGGHPVVLAAAIASLDILNTTDLIDQVESKSQLFIKNLNHPRIKEIRAKGLMLAVDLNDETLVLQMVEYALKHGILVDWFLYNAGSIRLAPPLIIQNEEIKKVCDILNQGLDSII
jgi:acetylornithine/succinyldiaminopimelate/putrescine aminotransferase